MKLVLSLIAIGAFGGIPVTANSVTDTAVGTIKKIDAATKTIVIKTVDGTERTIHFVKRTAVHGGQATANGTKDGYANLKEGTQVAVRYTTHGAKDTAREIDDLGKDGLHMTEGTIKKIDSKAKTITMTTAQGAEETYRVTDRAVRDASQEVAEKSEKAGRATVYYTEEAGRKVAHFFKRTP